MARSDKYSEQKLEKIAKVQSKKNARLKKRRARNAKLRADGKKFVPKKSVVAMGAIWDKDLLDKQQTNVVACGAIWDKDLYNETCY